MPVVKVVMRIAAPIERCFDLARSQRAHVATTGSTQERIVKGPAHDLLELGDEVTFEARHFGVRQRLTGRIVRMDRPREFVDEMVKGAFKSLRHIHRFGEVDGGTLMEDELHLEAPFGILTHPIVVPYMRRFLERRGQELKRIAESGEGLP